MKRIKKESLKNMMAEPLIHDEKSELGELCDCTNSYKHSEKKYSHVHKESGFGIHKLSGFYEKCDMAMQHKKSGVMGCGFNSDEDSKQEHDSSVRGR